MKTYLTILFILISNFLFSQNNFEKLDKNELDKIIETSFVELKTDPNSVIKKVELVKNVAQQKKFYDIEMRADYIIGNAYSSLGNYQKSIDHFQLAIKTCQTIDSTAYLAIIYNSLGWTYQMTSNYTLAESYYTIALKINNPIVNTNILCNLGTLYQNKGDYSKALEYYFEAKDYQKLYNQTTDLATILNNIATIYTYQNSYEDALLFFKEASILYKNQNDLKRYKSSLNNIGVVFYKQKEIDSAYFYYNQALLLSINLDDKNGEITALINLTNIDIKNKMLSEALLKTNKALNIATDIGSVYLIIEAMLSKVEIETQLKNYSEAISYLIDAKKIATSHEHFEQKLYILETLSELFEKNNNSKEALIYYREYTKLKDSIFTEEKTRIIENLKIGYESERKEQQIQILENEKKISKYHKMLLLLGISIIFFTLIILFYLFRLNIKNTKQKFKILEEEKKANNLELEKNKLQILNKELENKQLQSEIEYKQKELTTNAMHLLQNNEFNQLIVNSIKDIKEKFSTDTELQKSLNDVVNKFNLKNTDTLWNEFEVRFQEVHKDFYERLLEKFPDLTPNEIKICAFMRLNMNTKDISTITQQSTNSIRVACTRLRKKLEMSSDENLISFLMSF